MDYVPTIAQTSTTLAVVTVIITLAVVTVISILAVADAIAQTLADVPAPILGADGIAVPIQCSLLCPQLSLLPPRFPQSILVILIAQALLR